jgi:hypothetical protein
MIEGGRRHRQTNRREHLLPFSALSAQVPRTIERIMSMPFEDEVLRSIAPNDVAAASAARSMAGTIAAYYHALVDEEIPAEIVTLLVLSYQVELFKVGMASLGVAKNDD